MIKNLFCNLFKKKIEEDYILDTIEIKRDEINNMNSTQLNTNSKPTIHTPTTFAQVEGISNELLSNRSVIVDLTQTDIDIAKRICDFLNGVTFALNGKVEKVAKLVYLFSPK